MSLCHSYKDELYKLNITFFYVLSCIHLDCNGFNPNIILDRRCSFLFWIVCLVDKATNSLGHKRFGFFRSSSVAEWRSP